MADATTRRPYPKRGAARLFIDEAVTSSTDECIPWPFSITPGGYGQVSIDGRLMQAHRLVLELATELSPGRQMQAAHAPSVCHNRACVNPRHLRWATRVENAADKLIDGTHLRGDSQNGAKLTPDQIRAIRADGRRQHIIAAEHGITQAQVSQIRGRKTWAWLD